jgi:acyl phosphate:glycerol-3-phosphate acyltransferase
MKAVLLWTILGLFTGSVPFASIVVRSFMNADVRDYGDGNPGGMNAWRAGGWRLGAPVIILDILKGTLPVGMAHFAYGIGGWAIVPIALAPIIGHAYTPFLDFKGGKSVAVSYGVWLGLTGWQGPLMLAVGQGIFFIFIASDSWTTLLGMGAFIFFLYLFRFQTPLIVLAGINLAIFIQRYFKDLKPGLRPRFGKDGRLNGYPD